MLFKDELTGIEIEALVNKTRYNMPVKTAKGRKGVRSSTITRAQVTLHHPAYATLPILISAQSKQHPNDVYSQLQGKRLVFNKILKKIRELDNDNVLDTLYNNKKIRTAVWRIGEVFAGVRDKSTVFVDLPS